MCSFNNWCYFYRNVVLASDNFNEDEYWESVKSNDDETEIDYKKVIKYEDN